MPILRLQKSFLEVQMSQMNPSTEPCWWKTQVVEELIVYNGYFNTMKENGSMVAYTYM